VPAKFQPRAAIVLSERKSMIYKLKIAQELLQHFIDLPASSGIVGSFVVSA
jgi:hypothetical protein